MQQMVKVSTMTTIVFLLMQWGPLRPAATAAAPGRLQELLLSRDNVHPINSYRFIVNRNSQSNQAVSGGLQELTFLKQGC
jgi:hypothetical protein